MTEHKRDTNITKIAKIDKYKKKKKKKKKSEQHFYRGIQLHFGESNNKHIQIQQRNDQPQSSTQKRLTKIFNQ